MDLDSLRSWVQQADDPWMDFGDATAMLHAAHPSTVFLKTLRRHASVLDVGAGDGTLQVFKEWLAPRRSDLRMYAYAMQRGVAFDAYEAFELGTWPEDKPDFQGVAFDAIVAAHFIEHLEKPYDFVEWAVGRLKPGGRIYLEWPSDSSDKWPRTRDMHAAGMLLSISNFYDDHTHVAIPCRGKVIECLTSRGAAVEHLGVISNPFAEDEMRAHLSRGNADAFALQAIFWSKTRWAQYVVASIP